MKHSVINKLIEISIWGLILFGVSLSLCNCGKTTNNNQNNLYVYGDSISYGLSSPSWPKIIASRLNMNMIQNSHGGTSVFDSNAQGDLPQYSILMNATWESTAIVVWAPGVNDAILHGSDPTYQAQYQQGLIDVFTRLKQAKVKVYIGTPNHNANESRFVANSIVDQYATINRTVAAQFGFKLINFNQEFIPIWDQSLSYDQEFNTTTGTTLDGIHPNVYGYQLMAQYFLQNM